MISVIAVFWYYKEKCYGDEAIIDSKNAVTYGDYIQLNSDHFVIWPKYCKEIGLPPKTEYDKIPRGRILFHILTHHYIVIGSKAIVQDEAIQQNILQWYGLPRNTEFRWDRHYS